MMVLKRLDYNSVDIKKAARFSVAPMMDWTDRHCRYFHRKFTKKMQNEKTLSTIEKLNRSERIIEIAKMI